jgi:hypothetical protein
MTQGSRGTAARLSVLGAFLILGTQADGRGSDPAHAYLATTFHFTSGDLARVDRGHVVARTIAATDRREVATLGIVRVGVTPEFYVEQLADIARLKNDEAILQIGTFSTPPRLDDVAALTLDEGDIRSLRRCRVGSCGLQLPAEAIDRFRREINWDRAGAADRANDLMRRILVEYVGEYMRAGASAAMAYADGPERDDVGREFAELADEEKGSLTPFPALRRHLVEYPATTVPETADLLYWSKERIGRRGVPSVTHVAMARLPGASPARYAVASKQIYGAHYYHASLGLTVLVPAPRSEATTYLVYLNRSRIDVFGGFFGGIARKVVSGRARATVSEQLQSLQRTLQIRFCQARAC